jgi:hypothetical protein
VLQQKVLLVMPWLKHVSPLTAYCMTQLADKRRTASLMHCGDAFIAHTRNTCADLFLATKLEWMLTVDDDMIVPFGNAEWFNTVTEFNFPPQFAGLNAVDRLLSHGKTLVGALYFGRHKDGPAVYGEGMVHGAGVADARKNAPVNILKPTKWVGTGCMLIHRSVYEDIEKMFPRLRRGPDGRGGQWFTSSEHNAMNWMKRIKDTLAEGPMTAEKCMRAYEMVEAAEADAKANSSLAMGEDVQFCTRAKQAGHQPYVDFGCVCGHIGHHIYGPRA